MSACEVSLLVFSRRDWAPLLSLFACLLRSAAQEGDVADMLDTLAAPGFADRAREMAQELGHVVSPAAVIADMRAAAT